MRLLSAINLWICSCFFLIASVLGAAESRVSSTAVSVGSSGDNAAAAAALGYSDDNLHFPRRTINQWALSDFLLIGTVDGSLHARDRKTGLEMWSIQGETPLVKVDTLQSLEDKLKTGISDDSEESDIIWIVEPLGEGSLYYFMPSIGLQKLPVSIKQLVLESPFLISGDDKIYTGTRSTTLYSIDASTGEIIKVYGAGNNNALGKNECRPLTTDDNMDYDQEDEDFKAWKHDGVFMIGRTDYHLEIHNKSEIIWNVTFSTWGPNNMDVDLATQHIKSPDSLYVTPLHENSILALSANTTGKPAIWAGSLPSIAVHVFDVFRSPAGINVPLVLLPQPHYPLESGDVSLGTYVDRTSDGQWFALSGRNFPSLVRRAPSARWHPGAHFSGGREILYNSIVGVHSVGHEMYTPPPRDESSSLPAIHNEYLPALPYPTSSSPYHQQYSHKGSTRMDQYYGDGYSYPYRPRLPAPSTADYPTVDGPIRQPTLPTPTYGSWSQFILRLAENVVSVIVIVLVVFVAARFGWLPQMVDFLESLLRIVTGDRREPSLTELDKDNKVSSESRASEKDSDNLDRETDVTVEQDKVLDGSKIDIASPTTTSETLVELSEKHDTSSAENEKDKSVSESSNNTAVSAEATLIGDAVTSVSVDSNAKPSDKSISIEEPPKTDGEKTPVKKRKRGNRGGKKISAKAKAVAAASAAAAATSKENGEGSANGDEEEEEDPHVVPIKNNADIILENGVRQTSGLQASPLTVTEEPLGYGSQGTVVFKGIFEGREVAVKRMSLYFYDLASQEVTVLQESDDHPNVVRYYCKHQSDEYLYIALELCPGTLEDVIKNPLRFSDLVDRMNPIQVLHQIASGLHHLHSLKIVHRDIKPQNILVAPPKKLHKKGPNNTRKEILGQARLLISDFGLCKRLEGDQSSFRPTTAQPAGTAGWTAPEISMGSRYPDVEGNNASSDLVVEWSNSNRRLTRAVDIFSMGCVFYFVLSRGEHPFGVNSKREGNIEENIYDLSELSDYSMPNNFEAQDLIERMIAFNPKARPDAGQVLLHPLFWSPHKKLEFLLKFSDRFENDTRVEHSDLLVLFEKNAKSVTGDDWHVKLDRAFIDSLNKYRKYHGDRLIDLLRAMRNKSHHFNDLPPSLQQSMGPVPEGFLHYFTSRFPNLLMTVYYFAEENLRNEQSFRPYFEEDEE